MEQILESYLIALGVKIDQQAYRQFESTLARADSAVDQHTGGMLRNVLKVQLGIVGAFTAMSAAAIGLADKVAMADQGYRLFSLRMLMTQETGRKLKMIMDGLGASMEELIWDPEQRRRAGDMAQWIDHLTTLIGPNFAKNMIGIRDVRMQFTELGQAIQFLGMETASQLFEKLGIDAGSLHAWLEKMSLKIPHLADVFSTALIPILRDTKDIFKDIIGVGEGAAMIFTNLIGLLSGDDSIKGATFDFEKLAKAMGHVVGWADRAFNAISTLERSIVKLLSGDFKGALAELTPGAGAIAAGVGAGALGVGAAPFVGAAVTAGLAPFIGPFALPVGVAAAAATPAIAALLSGTAVYETGHLAARHKAQNGGSGTTLATPTASPTAVSPINLTGDAFVRLQRAIEKQEGYTPGTLAYRNNNPGNLKFVGQPGATMGEGGYAKFPDYASGVEAVKRQLGIDAGRGLTLGQEINKWAPPNENNTAQYLANVSASTGFSPNARLSDLQSGNVTVTVGDINITQPGASAAEIHRVVASATTEAVQKANRSDRQWTQAQLQPAF
jgi:hypothetical protein